MRLSLGGQDLWIVGVEDLWSGRCRPVEAIHSVPQDAVNLTLCHNPDAAKAPAATSPAGASTISVAKQVRLLLLSSPAAGLRGRVLGLAASSGDDL
ncbi:MAG: hypothetical protein WBC53_01385, partial [Phycisphaerae bacterium]